MLLTQYSVVMSATAWPVDVNSVELEHIASYYYDNVCFMASWACSLMCSL